MFWRISSRSCCFAFSTNAGVVLTAVDHRNLGPRQQAEPIADPVFVLAVLIVREADGGHAHLADDREILVLVGLGHRPGLAFAVLVLVDAAQGIRLAVEQEAARRIDAIEAQAERLLDAIEQAAALLDVDANAIEIRVVHAVPEMGLQDGDRLFRRQRLPRRHRDGSARAYDLAACAVQNAGDRPRAQRPPLWQLESVASTAMSARDRP